MRTVAGALGILAILLGIPLVLGTIALAIVPRSWPNPTDLVAALVRPDDGSLLVGVLLLVAALAWVQLTVSIVAELIAALRGRPGVRVELPGLRASRVVASVLVAALLGPATGTALAAPMPLAVAVAGLSLRADTSPSTSINPRYTVQARDTLWRIAETVLGDPLRWREVYALNAGQVQPDGGRLTEAALLHVGWMLQLPSDSPDSVIVKPGDTLSGIAARELHDPGRSGELAQLNRGHEQPDGHTLQRPDLIRPGWRITLPSATNGTSGPPSSSTPAPAPSPALSDSSPPMTPLPLPTPSPLPIPAAATPSAVPSDGTTSPTTATVSPPSTSSGSSTAPAPPTSPSSAPGPDSGPATAPSVEVSQDFAALPIGIGASGLVVAGLLAALDIRRRRQRRHRRPRHRIAVPEDAAGRLEWLAAATPLSMDATVLDRALRGLVLADWSHEEAPNLTRVDLSPEHARLTLSGVPVLPPPFVREPGDGRWDLPTAAEPELIADTARSAAAPFPLLASVATHDETALLLDLEALGVAHVTGLHEDGVALLRHLCVELANAAWAEDVEILVVGLGADMESLNPERVRVVPTLAAALAEIAGHGRRVDTALRTMGLTDVVAARLAGTAPDTWLPIVLFATDESTEQVSDDDRQALQELASFLDASGRRGVAAIISGIALVGREIHIAEDRQLLTPTAGPERWTAQGLPAGVVSGLADVLRPTDEPDIPVRAADPVAGWAEGMDEDGGVSAPPDSCPVDPEAARRLEIVDRQDPTLDDDLRLWHGVGTPDVPLIGILGQPTVRAPGMAPKTRPSWFTEVLVYLCLHPAGVTMHKALTDLWPDGTKINNATVRHAFYGARRWAGRGLDGDPERTFVGDMQSDNTYRLRGHLLDWDLFRRLRKRASARHSAHHADATADYRAALELIRGPVLSALRPGGFAWLNNHDQRHDLQIPGFLVDAAHELVDIALADGDLATARWAAETARSIDIDAIFDRPLTDLMRVAAAENQTSAMERYAAILLDARDFDVPEELPPETFAILNELLPHGPRRRPSP